MDNTTFELAEFETPVSLETIPPIVWSVEKYKVAQMLALHGKSKVDISIETKVPISTINSWCQHPDFKEYIKTTIEQAASTMKQDNISLLTKIIAARVAEAELSGDYSSLSKKDTLEIIKELNVITEDDTKKEESNYTKLLEKLVVASVTPKQIGQ
jgi:protoheme ferro-lyase